MSNSGWGSDDWRDHEFGAGQERYYGNHLSPTNPQPGPPPQRPPAPGPSEPSPGGPHRGRWAIIAGAAVLVVALAGGVLYLGTRSDDEPVAAGTGSPADGASPSPSPSAERAQAQPSSNTTSPQRNAGDDKDHATFDVPPAGSFKTGAGTSGPIWKMYTHPRDLAGYGSITGKNLAMGHGPTRYREGFCATTKSSSLGLFVWERAYADPVQTAASDAGDKWLKAVATRDDNKLEKYDKKPSLKSVVLKHSKTKAVQFRAKTPLTAASEKACGVSSAEVVVTAFETGKGTATLVAVRRLGHDDSMTDKQLSTILNSLRPA